MRPYWYDVCDNRVVERIEENAGQGGTHHQNPLDLASAERGPKAQQAACFTYRNAMNLARRPSQFGL
jgi:hypothetical protein